MNLPPRRGVSRDESVLKCGDQKAAQNTDNEPKGVPRELRHRHIVHNLAGLKVALLLRIRVAHIDLLIDGNDTPYDSAVGNGDRLVSGLRLCQGPEKGQPYS